MYSWSFTEIEYRKVYAKSGQEMFAIFSKQIKNEDYLKSLQGKRKETL